MDESSTEPHTRNDDAGPTMLVATDGSDASLHAIQSARRIFPAAASWELVTVIPHRIDPIADATGFAGPVLDEEEAREIDVKHLVDADAAVAHTARALGPVPVEAHVLRGDPGPVLCDHASLVDADILVVGAHDYGFLSRAMHRSVTDHLVRNAPCPVLVIPETTDTDSS